MAFEAIKLKNGNLWIPMRVEEKDGLVGEGFIEVEPGKNTKSGCLSPLTSPQPDPFLSALNR